MAAKSAPCHRGKVLPIRGHRNGIPFFIPAIGLFAYSKRFHGLQREYRKMAFFPEGAIAGIALTLPPNSLTHIWRFSCIPNFFQKLDEFQR